MADLRAVPLDSTQVALLEEIGEAMLRARDERAPKVLAIVLAWRFAGRPLSEREIPPLEIRAERRRFMGRVMHLNGREDAA